MKKPLLCLSLALGMSLNCYAQQPLPSNYSRTDTVRAVHNMFRSHRTGGIVWSVIGAAFTGRIIGAAASGNSSGNAGGTAVGVALFGGVPLGIGISKLARFSAAREKTATSDYEAGKALPGYIQRRLKKAKYFAG